MMHGPWLLRGAVVLVALPATFVPWALLSSVVFPAVPRHVAIDNRGSNIVMLRLGDGDVEVQPGGHVTERVSSGAPLDAVTVTGADGSVGFELDAGLTGDTKITISDVSGLPPVPLTPPAPLSPP